MFYLYNNDMFSLKRTAMFFMNQSVLIVMNMKTKYKTEIECKLRNIFELYTVT